MLYPTQKEIMEMAKPSFFYNLGTSSGKSLIGIYHYLKHRTDEPLLIICPPQKSRSGEWEAEVERVEAQEDVKIDYVVTPSSTLARKWKDYKGYFVLFDEAHYFKNPTSQRGKAAYNLTKTSTNFVLLTASPGEAWDDFMNYFIMFGHYKNKTQFLKRHAVYKNIKVGERVVKIIETFNYENELQDIWRKISITRPTEYFVDLPSVEQREITFKKAPIYNQALDDRVVEINGEEVILDSQMKLNSTLRYLTNQKEKINYLKMLMESTTENIIVFYQFRREAEDLRELVKKLGKKHYEVSGQASELPAVKDRPGLENSVTIVQHQSGSAAIELKYASVVVYYTPPQSYTLYKQSQGRAVRHGGKDHVTFYNFRTKGTIETHVWKALDNKQDFDGNLYYYSL